MIMQLYVAESTMLRIEKLEGINGEEYVKVYKDILDVFIYDSANMIYKSGNDAINSFAETNEKTLLLNSLELFTKVGGVNVKEARRRIADKLIEENRYTF